MDKPSRTAITRQYTTDRNNDDGRLKIFMRIIYTRTLNSLLDAIWSKTYHKA